MAGIILSFGIAIKLYLHYLHYLHLFGGKYVYITLRKKRASGYHHY